MVLYHLNETDPFLERWPFYRHAVTCQVYVIARNRQFSAFLSRSKSSMPVWIISALPLLPFLLKTLYHLLNKLHKNSLYCVGHLTALFKHWFAAWILGWLYLPGLQLNLLPPTLHHIHALQHRETHVELFPQLLLMNIFLYQSITLALLSKLHVKVFPDIRKRKDFPGKGWVGEIKLQTFP